MIGLLIVIATGLALILAALIALLALLRTFRPAEPAADDIDLTFAKPPASMREALAAFGVAQAATRHEIGAKDC